jgi:lysyl-tRNA synthetase class 2
VRRVPTVILWYLRVSALISVVAWLSAGAVEQLYDIWVLRWLTYFGWFPSLTWSLLLYLISLGIRRRKKAAWRLAVALNTLLFIGGGVILADGILDPEEQVTVGDWVATGFYGLALVLLVAARRQFDALPDRSNRRLALVVFLSCLVFTAVIGTAFVGATNRNPASGAWAWLGYAALQTLLGPVVTGHTLHVDVPGWADLLLGVLGSGLLVATMWALFLPNRRANALTEEAELAARRLLAARGDQDSLGYFATRRDKDLVVGPGGKAAVSYRVVGSVCLASGDPLGDRQGWDGAINAWLTECRLHAWVPGVMSAGERAATAYRAHGFDALELGDEAILDTRDLNLSGREMRQVRQAVRRVERAGYRVRIRRYGQIGPQEMGDLIDRADRWRDGETERGFSMALGRLGDPTDGRCVMVEALDRDGVLRGLLSFVPWGHSGLSLDLMRRDRQAENGLNEFMVAKLALAAPGMGVQRISLNFAVLRGVFERGGQIGAGPVIRFARRLLGLASRFWQLESLYLANAKYHPEWQPRFICFRHNRELLRLAVAAARAEGFLPVIRRQRFGHVPPSAHLLRGIEAIEAAAERVPVRARRLPEQERVRHAKLDRLRAAGIDPYPLGFPRADLAADIRSRFGALPPGEHTGVEAAVAGRIVLLRSHGRLVFADLRDESGDLQVMLTSQSVGDRGLREFKRLIDLGDQVGITGRVVKSDKGELSVLASTWTLTAKCLHPLPNKRTGLADPEARVRQRYVDLIVNDEARSLVRLRGEAVAAVRSRLRDRGFLEVETPMLQPVHGGAAARPFTTRINAYNTRLYLRIAPELYLKRLLVGGVGRVFELNRNFRNEGADATHNPEFTMLEAYEPYGTYDTMAELTRALVLDAARAALGTTEVVRDGVAYELSEPWHEITVYGSVSDALGEQVTPGTSLTEVRKLAGRVGLAFDPEWGQGRLVQELYEELVEGRLRFPTFVRDYPAATSPLTRPHRQDVRLAEKWDLIVFGMELGTAYSELIDPVLQRQRLTEQSLLAAGGDPEAMELDEDFLRALDYAMPPAGGMGMGIDRLLMTLTGRGIRDTITFPLVRPGM